MHLDAATLYLPLATRHNTLFFRVLHAHAMMYTTSQSLMLKFVSRVVFLTGYMRISKPQIHEVRVL